MTDSPRLDAPFEVQFHAGRAQEYIITRMLRGINTATLVKVQAVYPTDEDVGFVDVLPLVQQQATNGVVIDPTPMYRLPYMRMQGGVSAIVLDPAVGDIGLAVFASRDITTVIANKAPSPAATNRAYDAGDGLYLGGFLNAAPTQYLAFLPNAGGIRIVTPSDVVIRAEGNMSAEIGGDLTLQVAGNINVSAASTTWSGPVKFNDPIEAPEATINSIPFTSHKHPTAAPGSPSPPIP